MPAASGASRTSLESAPDCTRSATRRFVLARMFSFTAPEGRWVASSRCTPEAPAALGDAHQRAYELGQLGGKGGELVDHDEQAGQRRGAGGREGEVGGQVRGARGPQRPLPVAQLGLEAAQRPLAEVLVEVGHQPDGVRQPGALVEGGAALVVDEHEGEVVRVGGGGQRRRPGCAAARSCRSRWCPPTSACGPSADEVQHERPRRRCARRPPSPRGRCRRRPSAAAAPRRRGRRSAPAAAAGRPGPAARPRRRRARGRRSGPARGRSGGRSRSESPVACTR